MFCPRCGIENADARAACWSCFAQLRAGTGVKPEKAPKPAKEDRKKEKKGKKGVVVDEPIAVPSAGEVTPAAAAVAADAATVELEPVTAEVLPVAEPAFADAAISADFPLDIPAITVSSEPAGFDLPAEPAAAPFDFSSEPADDAAPVEDSSFIAGIPMSTDEEQEPAPNEGHLLDLDSDPVAQASYVIPGLADTEPAMAEDLPDTDDLDFGSAFDLDSEDPGKKEDSA